MTRDRPTFKDMAPLVHFRFVNNPGWQKLLLVFLLVLAMAQEASWARIPAPLEVPLARLLANAEVFAASHPFDAQGYYVLGRIHYLAFLRGLERQFVPYQSEANAEDKSKAPPPPEDPLGTYAYNDVDMLRQFEAYKLALQELNWKPTDVNGQPTGVTDDWTPVHLGDRKRYNQAVRKYKVKLARFGWLPDLALSWTERFEHADESRRFFLNAIRLDPKASNYPLALASLDEDVERLAFAADTVKPPLKIQRTSRSEIRSLVHQAVVLSTPPGNDWKKAICQFFPEMDLQEKDRFHYRYDDFVTFYEAAQNYLRMASEDFPHLSKDERSYLVRTKASLASREKFDKKNPGMISPVIFTFAPASSIQDLLSPEASVAFDLAGYGGDHRWPWVKPATGFLVWDPSHTGKIGSGRQLFGTYTFGIPWENGYRALAALDDNHDGVLTGSELQGLAVWFDREGNGISQPGEVISVQDLGITAIEAREISHDGIHPCNPGGITLRGGTKLSTWDWMAPPRR